MNTTEKYNLPVDGIFDMFSPLIKDHQHHQQQHHFTHQALQSATRSPTHPDLSKSGMGLINTVKSCLRQDRKAAASRSASSNHRQVTTDRLPKRSVDNMGLGLTKPRNCHRVVVLGAPRVGKTNILHRFLGKDFEEHYEPTTEDFHRKLFHIGGEAFQMDLLDAASERDFPAKRRLTILTGDIFLLVFSLNDRDSLNEVKVLLDEIKDAKAKLQKLKHVGSVPVVICGNKADLDAQRVVRPSEVGEILGEGFSYFETSAQTCSGLEAMFRSIASLGGLPVETSPSRHQIVPILTYRSLCLGQRGRRGSRTQGVSEPCAAMDPLARRPSFTTDLQMVLGSSTKQPKPEKCQIQ